MENETKPHNYFDSTYTAHTKNKQTTHNVSRKC